MKKKILQMQVKIWLAAVLLSGCFTLPGYAAEANKETIKVAYFNMGNYYREEAAGGIVSYDTEALNKICGYAGLPFEYVNCGTWSNALKMLNSHKVDLVGTMQWTPEREHLYEFCLESYGYTVGELVGLPEKNYVYEDYEAIGNSVIGCTKDYVRMDEMKNVFQKHGISPVIKTYEGQADLENALITGEIDLIAANSHTLREEWTVVEKFSYAPFYFVSWKGNKRLTDSLDDAIIAINLREPTSDDELLQKYFPTIIGEPLTKEELNLIAEDKTYDVYFDANTKPNSWYDEETGTMQGGLIEVCRQISENTGLKLNPVPMHVGVTEMDATAIRTTTVYNGGDGDFSDNPKETNALLDESFNLYYRNDTKINLSTDNYSIAIVAKRVHLKSFVEKEYPGATIQEYDTPLACLNAVKNGQADLTYLDCRIADNTITENGILNVREFPTETKHQGIALIFPCENSELLVSIVNKGLKQVDETEISNLFVQYALEAHAPVTWSTIAREHFGWLAAGIVFLCLVLIGFAVLLTYARVMKNQKDKITQADADKTEFFARMSHDMRTPMNGILGMIRLSRDSDSMAEIKGNMGKAESAGEYMLSLINDTLDLQRMESKKLQLEKNIVNVGEYYGGIISIMKISAEEKQLDFKVQYLGINKDDYIELDAVRVKQILSNLISNAIKFTPPGGAVEVTIEAAGEEGDALHRKYQVRDTGVGMSEEFIQNRLFKPYSQENNELSSQLTGSGLGMAITKNLVELMDGHLEVESSLGEGTVFTAYFDVRRASQEAVERAKQDSRLEENAIFTDLAGKRILLCEDHPLNAEIARKLLEKAGCSVTWAENGQLGVECFKKSAVNSFDIILMDIRMPVMDGLAAAKAIRSLDRADAAVIPIIAMTANAYESDIRNCMDAGMNAHLAKPVNPQRLYKAIHDCL